MNPQSVRELLARQPFQPFEIRMSNGDTYPVRHPECLALAGSRVVVTDPVGDRVDILALIHINGYRMLPATTAA